VLACTLHDGKQCFIYAKRWLMRLGRGQRVEDVDNGKNAGVKSDGIPGQGVRVSVPIMALMVMADYRSGTSPLSVIANDIESSLQCSFMPANSYDLASRV
jgi:hypothetical protein